MICLELKAEVLKNHRILNSIVFFFKVFDGADRIITIRVLQSVTRIFPVNNLFTELSKLEMVNLDPAHNKFIFLCAFCALSLEVTITPGMAKFLGSNLTRQEMFRFKTSSLIIGLLMYSLLSFHIA